jgi:hypothetical protein
MQNCLFKASQCGYLAQESASGISRILASAETFSNPSASSNVLIRADSKGMFPTPINLISYYLSKWRRAAITALRPLTIAG